MLRLFISLYLLIAIGLLAINYSSNLIFSSLENNVTSEKLSDIQSVSQLTSGYAKLLANGDITLAKLKRSADIQTQLVNAADFAFLPEQQQTLAQKGTVHLFAGDAQLMLYTQVDLEHLLQFGPITLSPVQHSNLQDWLIIFSYLMLALLVFSWSKPLWRDLTTLITMTNQVSEGKLKLEGTLSSQSVLSPLEHALKSMTLRIAQLVSTQKQMLHAVSHDIRTPLARMKFSLAMLNKSNEQESKQTQTSLLADISEVETLIDQLLSYGKMDNLGPQLTIEQVNLSELLTNLVDKLAPLSELSITLNANPNCLYKCDGHLLERSIQNLITNAQKFGLSSINVSLNESLETLDIVVEDDGKGIPASEINDVLKPFTRLEKSRNKQSGGFGLGLAIVNKIVAWHNGSVSIDKSNLGGAKVTLSFPKL